VKNVEMQVSNTYWCVSDSYTFLGKDQSTVHSTRGYEVHMGVDVSLYDFFNLRAR